MEATRSAAYVTELNAMGDLRSFGPLWRALMRQSGNASYVQSLEFLRAAWPLVGHGRRLRIVLVHEDGEVVCVLPLSGHVPSGSPAGLRCLTHALPEFGYWSGPVGTPSVTAVKAALHYLAASSRKWDVLELMSRSDEVSSPSAVDGAFGAARLGAIRVPVGFAAFVDCSGDHLAYWRARPVSYRRRLAECSKRLQSYHRLRYVRVRAGDPGSETSRLAAEWPAIGRQLTGASGSSASDASGERVSRQPSIAGTRIGKRNAGCGSGPADPPLELVVRLHDAAWADRAVDWNLLMLDGEPAAFVYSYVWDGNVHTVCSGRRTGAEGEAALSVLIARMIEDSFRRGDRSLHFAPRLFAATLGAQTATHVLSRWVLFSRRTVRGQLGRLRFHSLDPTNGLACGDAELVSASAAMAAEVGPKSR